MKSAFRSASLSLISRSSIVLRLCSLVSLSVFLLLASCVGPRVASKLSVVRKDIDKAEQSGAYRCSPKELALAKANADFTDNELGQGNFVRAQQHVEIAIENVHIALVNSKDCGPRRVLIKKNTDKDGDGIKDKEDACPEKPEDFDNFEDEDGCPEADNDNDNILDPIDNCPNEAEDFDEFEDEDGCPDTDNDKDTVLDVEDTCPNTPGPVENKGCPVNDKDGDGIPDDKDQCPEKPEDFDGDRDEDGCPDVDSDGDGLEDDIDECPDEPEDMDGFKDEDGCPDIDNDEDGILDGADACPNEAGLLKANGCPDKDGDTFPDKEDKCPDVPGVDQMAINPEQHGCPRSDKDGDTILDEDDKCPDEAGIPQPDNPEQHGCPLRDTDGDGIYDKDDKCPNEVGVAQPENPDQHGCPKKYKLIIVKKDRIEIQQQVKFATGKARIKRASYELLAEVADAIRSSNLSAVHIQGHTDSVGSNRSNKKLSQRRADSVMKHLVEREGVDESLLDAEGFGEDEPHASNRTKKGRAQNRRVEFHVVR
ncbi:MAG: OmpA family protein [Deltaproteobacteria bacterium]|nr:OmpA family protein [Deltaproteobacteria bacterium]